MSLAALRHAVADAWMLSLAPGLPARLPWRVAWAIYRNLARGAGLYRESVNAATVAQDQLPSAEVATFRRQLRTTLLLDVADLHLSRRQPVDWLPAHVTVQGEWPRTGAFVVVTFHYGNGLWICRALRRAGHNSRFLSARFERAAFTGRPLLHRYGAQRLIEVERIGGEPVAYRPGVRASLLATLARGVPVVGLIDVPPRLAPRGQHAVELLGRPASLPDGLLHLADAARVPIVPCHVELDFASGHRRVIIGEARAPLPVTQVLAGLAGELDRMIRVRPGAWMFWPEWPAWQRDAASLHAP